MRIAFVKPDWGFRGGFELVAERLAGRLADDGHDVRHLNVAVSSLGPTAYGVGREEGVDSEFLRYTALVEAFAGLDASRADLVISTQPPSFVTGHDRHLSVFYHHERMYYDLAEVMIRGGFVDAVAHREAACLARAIDQPHLERVSYFLAGSEAVRDRLRHFNGLDDNVGVFHAGMGVRADLPRAGENDRFTYPLLISRHEFPKRTELFVHAMKLLDDLPGVAVGAGGRLGYVQQLDARLSALGSDVVSLASEPLWLCQVPYVAAAPPADETTGVRFEGHVTDAALERHLREALCLVAPAFMEDYGLTVLEAMAHGKPAIVCADGGNLANLVEDGVTGFVVEPTGQAIAAAIERLHDDISLCRRMGAAARDVASTYTWDRSMAELMVAVDRVMG